MGKEPSEGGLFDFGVVSSGALGSFATCARVGLDRIDLRGSALIERGS